MLHIVGNRWMSGYGSLSLLFFFSFNLLTPTGYVMHQQFNIQQFYVLPTLYLCFVFIWEQTATCATYSIKWLVFITEVKSVYCAVRTGSLNIVVCASYLKGQSTKLITFETKKSQRSESRFNSLYCNSDERDQKFFTPLELIIFPWTWRILDSLLFIAVRRDKLWLSFCSDS